MYTKLLVGRCFKAVARVMHGKVKVAIKTSENCFLKGELKQGSNPRPMLCM